jgi:site-specific recombinase XerD
MYVGFPLGEVLYLNTTDIESKMMKILIRNGKGSKKRMLSLSHLILKTLRK